MSHYPLSMTPSDTFPLFFVPLRVDCGATLAQLLLGELVPQLSFRLLLLQLGPLRLHPLELPHPGQHLEARLCHFLSLSVPHFWRTRPGDFESPEEIDEIVPKFTFCADFA